MKIKDCEDNVWAILTPEKLIGSWEIPYMSDVERVWVRNMEITKKDFDHKGRLIVHAEPTYYRRRE